LIKPRFRAIETALYIPPGQKTPLGNHIISQAQRYIDKHFILSIIYDIYIAKRNHKSTENTMTREGVKQLL